MEINRCDTAVLITDPQNAFLSEKGVNFGFIANDVRSIDDVIKLMG